MIGSIAVDVTTIEPDKPISTGIRWRRIAAILVPQFEEHSARLERGISLRQWYDEMDEMERAIVIAVRRLQTASDNIVTEAQTAAAKKDMKRGKK